MCSMPLYCWPFVAFNQICRGTYDYSAQYVVYLKTLKIIAHTIFVLLLIFFAFDFSSCKKDKITTDPKARVEFSQDSVLFDTVFTGIGSSTRNIRVRNKNKQRIKIASIHLRGGSTSAFILNVDGAKGTDFQNVEIAANDSIYIFIQVHINPNNANSPAIVNDALDFSVNGQTQTLVLEAWGQDAYYHMPTNAFKYKDGTYFAYSIIDTLKNSYTRNGNDFIWKNDKPHVIYGYLAVDSLQHLIIPAGTKVYLNYKAGIWVYNCGQIKVMGEKDKEVIFQGARLEKDYADEPGQWDRIWINEGSDGNVIDYAIIKNAFIGVQAELFFPNNFYGKGSLTITNTRIQNMSKWGIYGLAYKIYGGNNVVVNCQESCFNAMYGGSYKFYHCTFANYWNKDKPRDQACINLNNYTDLQVLQDTFYFGNCIIDGKLNNELNLDLKSDASVKPVYAFNNCWIRTTLNTVNNGYYFNVRSSSTDNLLYKDTDHYNFEPDAKETRIQKFANALAEKDAAYYPFDIKMQSRYTTVASGGVTAGAYEIP